MLNPGEKLGPYAVGAKLGAGGMGVVFRATDTKLGRDVALKVLHESVAADAQRMARFQREAQVLAALNHPNIAAIYGLEEGTGSGGQGAGTATRALVMELVPGLTLAERIAQGAIPFDEALPIAKQIADALEYAHERGIVHRDLKPANIKLTPDGQVKVLDFGLAKALQDDTSSPEISNSPTMSMAATKAGVILGTAAYMSPEQAKGKLVDRRTDVWAYGCVLYEMLAGKHAFPGEDVSETLAAIIRGEPDWSALPANLPAPIEKLIKRCLQKDAKRRLQAIGEARLAIEDYVANPSAGGESATVPGLGAAPSRASAWPIWALAAMTLVAVVFAAAYFTRPAPETPVVRALIPSPDKTNFSFVGSPTAGPVAISPDGRWLAFASVDAAGGQMLWVRAVDEDVARLLPGTEGAAFPFWSPDSRTIAFFAADKLKRIEANGGPATAICNAGSGRGGTWNREGVILASLDANAVLHRVSASGGSPRPVTTLDRSVGQSSHRWPHFLPDGQHFLYLARAGMGGSLEEGSGIWLGSLDGRPAKFLLPGASNAVFASGFLLFARESVLMAQAFNPDSHKLSGEPFPVIQQMQFDPAFSRAVFSVSENGMLVYQPGDAAQGTKLVWFDRRGKQVAVLGDPALYVDLKISPDGKKVAVTLVDPRLGPPDVWIYETARGLRTRFTFHPGVESNPVWSPDGTSLTYRGTNKGIPDLYRKLVTGAGEESPLLESDATKFPVSYSPDGRLLAYELRGLTRNLTDIWLLPMTPQGAPRAFLETQFRETQPHFSPDGRWIAYVSDESGRDEVYVTPFPGPGRKWQISTQGGVQPRWRGDGREIFYLARDNTFVGVEVSDHDAGLEVGAAKKLFQATMFRRGNSYDVTRDGQRFLVNLLEQQQSSPPLTLVVNWPKILKKK